MYMSLKGKTDSKIIETSTMSQNYCKPFCEPNILKLLFMHKCLQYNNYYSVVLVISILIYKPQAL